MTGNDFENDGADWRGRSGKRREVRFDRYALFDVGREHALSPLALWLLTTICLLSDYRSRSLRVTLWELHEHTRMSRTTVRKTLSELTAAGLVAEARPFGRNRAGEVVVTAWDRLIVGSGGHTIANQSRSNREPIANSCANDQGEEPQLRQQGSKEEATPDARASFNFELHDDAEPCGFSGCRESYAAHTFCEHELVHSCYLRDTSGEVPDLPDASNIIDEAIGHCSIDRRELHSEVEGQQVGMTQDQALAAILRVFPDVELVDAKAGA